MPRSVHVTLTSNPYQPPQQARRHLIGGYPRKVLPLAWAILIAFVIPGLPVWVMRRDWKGFIIFATVIAIVPLALLFFGPFWDLVLFDGTPYDQWGFYPFLATLVAVPCLSVLVSIKEHRKQRARNPI